jgi:hypothetical protein
MHQQLKRIVVTAAITLAAAALAGCGGSETNPPAAAISTTVVASQADTTSHSHSVTVPFTDYPATPADSVHQYRSSDSGGHSHVIALTGQQLTDLSNGLRVTVTSSSANGHTHTWSFLGGSMLYDKYCYNCHSNDKRGNGPMNVSMTPSQGANLANPGGAPLSTAPAATPDPNYDPSAPTPPTPLDGTALYGTYCQSCHNPLGSTTKPNRTATQIRAAITGNSGGMGSLAGLTDAQLAAIAAVLVR